MRQPIRYRTPFSTVAMRLGMSFVALTVLAVSGVAQPMSTHDVGEVGVRVRIITRLAAVPMKFGENAFGAALRGQFLPTAEKDKMIRANTEFEWGVQVLEFKKRAAVTGKRADDKETNDPKELAARWRRELEEKYGSKDFEDFAVKKDPSIEKRKFVVRKKAVAASGKRPAYDYWEYVDEGTMQSVRGTGTDPFWRYHIAAAYKLAGREVVVLFHWPLFRSAKPDKWRAPGRRMVESLELIEEGSGGVVEASAAKSKFADTKDRKEMLERAIKNIRTLKGWDYYTTQNYICLFSWDARKPEKRLKSLQFARTTTDQMEQVREVYEKYFPRHKNMQNYYPVLRICHNQELFESYGGMGGGVVGWFNTGTKELVIFYDSEGVYGGKKGTKTVAFHEGWHQYADAYFGSGNMLHRWIGEGMGDWFGAWNKVGARWAYTPDQGRIGGVA
ncbi:MAG: hypothetical protein KDC87_09260, partial [Planctomycetes bacterium]|nr:hypothetical protein [Planctomycetota bacterium]